MQQPRTTRLEDIGTNSRCSQCGYTRVDLPYKNEQNMRYTIEEIRQMPEGQTFDCKSIHIEPKALANTIVAMANADGGMIAVGIRQDSSYRGCQPRQDSFERDTSHSV